MTVSVHLSTGGRRDTKATPHKEDVPIGLNSLSKTFNIIQIVGQGQLFSFYKFKYYTYLFLNSTLTTFLINIII